jgi:hypothetical protein
MAVYAVYAPPGDLDRSEIAERVVFVREGFRPLAFLLPWLYFLLHRAWLPLLVYALGFAAVNVASAALALPPGMIVLTNLLFASLIGLEAPGLRQWSLRRKGFRQVGSVVARKPEEAEMRFFASVAAREHGARATPVGMPREHAGALLFAEPGRPR